MNRLFPTLIVVAGIPSLAIAQSLIAPGASVQKLAGEYEFTEGPATDAAGHVFFTDQPNDRIVRWDADTGEVSDWMKPAGRSNGMFFGKDGNLFSCADEKNELWAIAPDKSVTVLIKAYEDKLLNGPNDVWVHPNGDLYFTDPLYKRPWWERDPESQQDGRHVYRLSADRATLERVATDLVQPNGIIGTPDGKTLYVADINARKTWAYDIQADGTLSGKRLFCESGSDGMSLDELGNVYLTGRGVSVYNSKGEKIEQIDVPERWTANVTFGGKDRNLLFITASKGIYGLKMNVRGAF